MIDTMSKSIILAALCICAVAQSLAAEIALADVSASASVENAPSKDGYGITVEFLPVTTLDDTSNDEMTRTMAQFYAEEALSNFLNALKAINFRKVSEDRAQGSKGRTRFAFRVPGGAVIDAPAGKVELREEIVSTRKTPGKAGIDTKAALLDFRSTCFRDLRVAEALFAEELDSAKDGSEKEGIRRKIEGAFAALRRKIKEDDGLFRAEKSELREKADKIERYLMEKTAGDTDGVRETNGKALPIANAVFKEPYGALLKADAILLAHGGARFVEMEDGCVAILAVGSAAADNDDREDIAELQASASLGKLQGGEETIVKNSLDRRYSRSSGNDDNAENMELKRLSRTITSSIDFHQCGETVGTWFSPDGKRFFMAKGRIVRPKRK